MSRLEDYVKVINHNRGRYYLGGSALDYLRNQANLPYPTTKLNGVDDWEEGQQWLLRGDQHCDLVGIRVYRYPMESDYRQNRFTIWVLYKKGTWERLEQREGKAKGNGYGQVELNGWQPLEDILNEFADIIMHLLDVYQVAVIK
tara:strand:- start:1010 stop:1441 length:432 start_codon:yes stop_codon:yes gene_type:complete